MESLCREILDELVEDNKQEPELAPLVASLKALNLAFENLPEIENINQDLIYYWMRDEAIKVKDLSIEELVEHQKAHVKRQEALKELITHTLTRMKAKESATYLLINKAMETMSEADKAKVKKLLGRKVSPKGKAPKAKKKAKTQKERQLEHFTTVLGYSKEDAMKMLGIVTEK